MVVSMVGFAANVCVGLWTRSTVDSIAYDAARAVATAPLGSDPVATQRTAVRRAKSLLGDYGDRVSLTFEHQPDSPVVVLRVRTPGTTLMPRLFSTVPVVGAIDRRIVVTKEEGW
jgi:hypothetical protein